ncbi:Histidine phosphatase superfamily (branch 2) [Phytophthora infestans]|uniref:Multiple inositol polyphosphate phosphatase 1 n=1 Tax=Phytophthora infestans TaxID=4787 RepID=A0A833SQJ9_PHYIN|nr:Histidine phosphatase superfamily (branch 2) [Phytophthora infestans]
MLRMELVKFLLLLAAICTTASAAEGAREVLSNDMSTKTLYAPPTSSESDILEEVCIPVQLNFAIRHGTRNPTMKDITRINTTHTRLLKARNGASITWVESWINPFPMETQAWLADPGVRELIEIGHRLRARLSPLPVFYDASKFVFEHTWKIRTKQSAEAFAFGFFDGLQPVYYHSHPIGQDEVLRFYDNCPVFEMQIDSNKSSTIEHSKYRDSDQMRKNLAKFQRLTGFAGATQKDMEAAYAGCAFDVAVQAVFDQWCSFFDDEMLLSMDYFQDLKHFYRKSHGHPLSYEIATPLLQDIFRTMKQRVDGKSHVEGFFRFAHAETILPLASLLNVSYFDRHASDHEGHFRADTPLELALQRKFKSSELAPFAANIGFVLYECADPKEESKTKTTFKVKTLLNEREVVFKECKGQDLCPFDVLENIFRRWIYEFDFQKHCTLV